MYGAVVEYARGELRSVALLCVCAHSFQHFCIFIVLSPIQARERERESREESHIVSSGYIIDYRYFSVSAFDHSFQFSFGFK